MTIDTTDQQAVTATLWLERAEHCNPILPTPSSPMFAAVAEEMEEYAECKVAAFARLASVSSASAETADYRALLIQAGRNAGAFIDDRASDAFLNFIPEEVRLKVASRSASPEPVPATNQADGASYASGQAIAVDACGPVSVPATNQAGEVEGGCTMGVGCDEAGVCYAVANGHPSMCERSVTADPLRKALLASLAKRSVPTMDPPYTAAFNAALDMVERDTASSLPVLSDEVVALVIAAREFWDDNNDQSDESHALDKALEAFSSRVPYDDEPSPEPVPATNQAGEVERGLADAAERFEAIRLTLIDHLDEPVRSAFWCAVEGKKRLAALATQPATSQEGNQSEIPIGSIAATPTPPTLSEDLREALLWIADRCAMLVGDEADGWEDMVKLENRARAALARAQEQAS